MRGESGKERARALAAGQAGRVTYAQLIRVGLTRATIERWIRDEHLIRVLPRVYALGHLAPSLDARRWEAILYAGPGACLTAASGAHQRKLIEYPPAVVHVASPRRPKQRPGIKVYPRRQYEREHVDGIPVAPLPETMLDLAATEELRLVRKALGRLDFRRQLHGQLAPLTRVCGHGRPGSAALRRALARHQPELGHTNGPLEEDFLLLLEREGLPIPLFNRTRHGVIVDAVWDGLRLVVELDGDGAHHSGAQLAQDAARQRVLEAHGLTVLRYDWDDVHSRRRRMLADLASRGVCRARGRRR